MIAWEWLIPTAFIAAVLGYYAAIFGVDTLIQKGELVKTPRWWTKTDEHHDHRNRR